MAYRKSSSRTLLQRRSSLSNIIQRVLDGTAVIGITWGLVHYHEQSIGGLTSPYVVMLLMLLVVLAISHDKFAIYRSNVSFTEKSLRLLHSWTLTFFILVVIAFLTKQSETYSRHLIAELYIFGFLTQLALHFLVRVIYQNIILHAKQYEKGIIVGSCSLAMHLQQKISGNPWIGEQIIGCVQLTDDDALSPKQNSLKVLGKLENLTDLIDKHDITTVYIVTPLESSKVLEELYMSLVDKHVSIHWVPDIFSLRLVNHSVKEISGVPVLTLSETPLIGIRRLLKSVEDKVFSVLILILISPILILVAIMVKLSSPGPVFFRQYRKGWSGKAFRIWKFRSMYVHAEAGGKLKQAEKNDSRVTPVGAFIRKTSLDELPQIFNVLLGDMSLVGPRPHAVQHDEEYSRRIFDYFARHNIKPGITGLAQVRGFRGETKDIDQMIMRIESDIEYINNWSVALDIVIILRTVFSATGKNAY